MISKKSAAVLLGCVVACTSVGYGDFVPDEFDGSSLGPQWTWYKGQVPGKGDTDSTYTMTGNAFRFTVDPGADQSYSVDNYCRIEQDAPSGTNWEVVTKIDNFDTSTPGYQLAWQKVGLMLYQDTEHWLLVSLQDNSSGTPAKATTRGIQGVAQFDPTTSVSSNAKYVSEYTFWDNTSTTIYLKIRKTPKGYTGFYSGDGVNYTQLSCLIKNPETSDGMFQGEKIRLMQSGGNTTDTGALAHFADVDFVRTQAIDAPASGYKDDEFNGTSLDPTWFYSEGVRAGSMSVSSGTLNLQANIDEDFWENTDRSSFVSQDAPTDPVYSLVTKVSPNDLRSYQNWCGHGMKLWQDQNNWVAISAVRSSNGRNYVQVAYQQANGVKFDSTNVDFVNASTPGYLRIDQDVNGYLCQYSTDGVNWTAVPATGKIYYPAPLHNAQVHLYAKKSSNQAGTILVSNFDYIHKVALQTAAKDWQLLE